MNAWDLSLNLLGWLCLVMLVLISLFMILVILKTAYKFFKDEQRATLDEEELVEAVQDLADKQYGTNDMFGQKSAFVLGAKHAITLQKSSNHVDHI